jgi:hypothetical protein
MKIRHKMKGIYKKVYNLPWDGICRIKPSIYDPEDFNTEVLALISIRPPPNLLNYYLFSSVLTLPDMRRLKWIGESVIIFYGLSSLPASNYMLPKHEKAVAAAKHE